MKRYTHINNGEIILLYKEKKYTVSEIAKHFQVSRYYVYSKLRECHIEIRNGCNLHQPCWNCIHAVPSPFKKVGCNWSMFGQKVDGWIAEKVTIDANATHKESYKILYCPKFCNDQPHRK